MCCLCLFQGRVAGLLWPRPFLNKLSIALSNRKFCERHKHPLHTEPIQWNFFGTKFRANPRYMVLLCPPSLPALASSLSLCVPCVGLTYHAEVIRHERDISNAGSVELIIATYQAKLVPPPPHGITAHAHGGRLTYVSLF
jgi:hypothetical protein